MPNGLPAAIKLQRPALALHLDITERQRVTLEEWPSRWLNAGELVQPIEPLADVDGWDGHWRANVPALNLNLAIPGDELRFSAHL